MAQEGSPPRRPGRPAGSGRHGAPGPYDADPYRADPRDAPASPAPYDEDPYGPADSGPASSGQYGAPPRAGRHSGGPPAGEQPPATTQPAPGEYGAGRYTGDAYPPGDPLAPRDYGPRETPTPDPFPPPAPRDPRAPTAFGTPRDPGGLRDPRDARDPGAFGDPRAPGDPGGLRDPRDARDPSAFGDLRDPGDIRDPRDVRDPGGLGDPRDVLGLRDPRDPRSRPGLPDPYGTGPQRAAAGPAAPSAPPAPASAGPASASSAPASSAPARPAARRPVSRPGSRDTWAPRDPFAPGGEEESDLPPWAGPSIHATRAGGTRVRPPAAAPEAPAAPDSPAGPSRRGRGRAAAARLRKGRRRVYAYCGTAIAAAVVVALVFVLLEGNKAAPSSDGLITTLQRGELATVPSACAITSPDLVSQFLPGKVTQVSLAGTSATFSQCSFTVDARPVFRVLEVSAQAYQPSAVVSGNGSATDNARDEFTLTEQTLASPGRKSAVPPAQVTPVAGLGQEAFRGLQVIRRPGSLTDLVTVVTRYRNVLITVSLQAQASGGGFGPVQLPDIEAGAQAIASEVLSAATKR